MLSQNNSLPVIPNEGDKEGWKDLIDKAKCGESLAFGELYTRLYTPLYRYVMSKCHDRELTVDVCQQVFLKFYESLLTYSLRESPLPYLFTIAKRLLINHKEKKTFIPFEDALKDTHQDDSNNLLEEINTRLLAQSINGYLLHLTEDEQEVIRLYFYAELTYTEIALTLKKKEGYIRKIKERGLKKLRSLTQHLNEEK